MSHAQTMGIFSIHIKILISGRPTFARFATQTLNFCHTEDKTHLLQIEKNYKETIVLPIITDPQRSGSTSSYGFMI
jgi:hypothetical protein